MPIQLEGGSRLVSDDEKLNVYMQIVRLFLEVSFLAHSYCWIFNLHLNNQRSAANGVKPKHTLLEPPSYPAQQARRPAYLCVSPKLNYTISPTNSPKHLSLTTKSHTTLPSILPTDSLSSPPLSPPLSSHLLGPTGLGFSLRSTVMIGYTPSCPLG